MNLTFCQRYRFFSVIDAIIRESSNKQLVLRIVKVLPFIHQPDRVAPKASDVSAADWLYQHMSKSTIFFHVCCYGFSQGRKSLCNPAVYVMKQCSSAQCRLNEVVDSRTYARLNVCEYKCLRNLTFCHHSKSPFVVQKQIRTICFFSVNFDLQQHRFNFLIMKINGVHFR